MTKKNRKDDDWPTAKEITLSNARAQKGMAADASAAGDYMKAALHQAHADRMTRQAQDMDD